MNIDAATLVAKGISVMHARHCPWEQQDRSHGGQHAQSSFWNLSGTSGRGVVTALMRSAITLSPDFFPASLISFTLTSASLLASSSAFLLPLDCCPRVSSFFLLPSRRVIIPPTQTSCIHLPSSCGTRRSPSAPRLWHPLPSLSGLEKRQRSSRTHVSASAYILWLPAVSIQLRSVGLVIAYLFGQSSVLLSQPGHVSSAHTVQELSTYIQQRLNPGGILCRLSPLSTDQHRHCGRHKPSRLYPDDQRSQARARLVLRDSTIRSSIGRTARCLVRERLKNGRTLLYSCNAVKLRVGVHLASALLTPPRASRPFTGRNCRLAPQGNFTPKAAPHLRPIFEVHNSPSLPPLLFFPYTSGKDPASTMSTASKITLASTIAGTVGVVYFVHWAQTAEKAVSLLIYDLCEADLLTHIRQCMLGLSAMLSNKGSRRSVKPTSRCRGSSRRSTRRPSRSTTVPTDEAPACRRRHRQRRTLIQSIPGTLLYHGPGEIVGEASRYAAISSQPKPVLAK